MAKFMPIIIALLITGMFAIALLSGIMSFQKENDAVIKITDDPEIGELYSNISSSLSTTSDNANVADNSFKNSTTETTGVTPYITAIGGIWKLIKVGPTLIWKVLVTFIFDKLLGGDPAAFIIATSLAAILVLMIISAVVYMISRGEGG
jgi:hypothetical protein